MKEWFFKWWLGVLLGVSVSGALVALALVVWPAEERHRLHQKQVKHCVRVLECVDRGVSREHCDALFPE